MSAQIIDLDVHRVRKWTKTIEQQTVDLEAMLKDWHGKHPNQFTSLKPALPDDAFNLTDAEFEELRAALGITTEVAK